LRYQRVGCVDPLYIRSLSFMLPVVPAMAPTFTHSLFKRASDNCKYYNGKCHDSHTMMFVVIAITLLIVISLALCTLIRRHQRSASRNRFFLPQIPTRPPIPAPYYVEPAPPYDASKVPMPRPDGQSGESTLQPVIPQQPPPSYSPP